MVLSGCQSNELASRPMSSTDASDMPVVTVSSYPLYALTSELAGNNATVVWPARESSSPRQWTPDSDEIKRFQSSDLILLAGANYESWTHRVTLPRSRTYDVSAGYSEKLIARDFAVDHQHGPNGSGAASEMAWGTWLNPELCMMMLAEVTQQLCKVLPDNAASIQERSHTIHRQLDQVRGEMLKIASPKIGQFIALADGPGYEYLADRMRWEIHHMPALSDNASPEEKQVEWSTAIQKLKPQLIIYGRESDEISTAWVLRQSVPAARVDLCEFADASQSFTDRLMLNITNLKVALTP